MSQQDDLPLPGWASITGLFVVMVALVVTLPMQALLSAFDRIRPVHDRR